MSDFRSSRFEVRPCARLPGEVGLYARTAIAAGERLIDPPYRLRLMSHQEFAGLDAETRAWVLKWCLGWPDGYMVPENSDALTLGWFLNHSCAGNVGFNELGEVVALRAVPPGEELTYDYALCDVTIDPLIEHCSCGSADCRGRISGLDWRDDDWWLRSGAHAHPIVRRVRASRY